MSLKEMLQRQGLTPIEVSDFIEVLQQTYDVAEGMEGYGVTEMSVETLRALRQAQDKH